MERGTCVRLGTRGRAILVKQCETAAAGAPGCPCPGVSGLWLVDRVSLRASSIAASLCVSASDGPGAVLLDGSIGCWSGEDCRGSRVLAFYFFS